MQRSHQLVPSQIMQRSMHLWRFGHFGAPLLVFPSAAGMAHEWDAHGMVDALADLIDGGRLKLYCTETNVAEAWTDKASDPRWRMQRHQTFERYVIDELVPFIRSDCRSADIRIAAAGCSLGAYYSANFALKHPEVFHWVLCMSGRYDMVAFSGGFNSADMYFNNPLAFVPNLEGEALERVRRNTHLVLVCGQGRWEDGNIEETQAMADLLQGKGISHDHDLWGRDVSHEWVWWRRQARMHLARFVGGKG